MERYADAVFRRDTDDWTACWADDARWDLAGTIVDGRDAIRSVWEGAMAGFEFVAFFAQPGPIRVDGDGATGRCWTQELLVEGGTTRRVVGRYDDRFVRRSGGWQFAERRFDIVKEWAA